MTAKPKGKLPQAVVDSAELAMEMLRLNLPNRCTLTEGCDPKQLAAFQTYLDTWVIPLLDKIGQYHRGEATARSIRLFWGDAKRLQRFRQERKKK